MNALAKLQDLYNQREAITEQINKIGGLLPTEWVKTGGFCEFMPILKGFSLTWRSLANGMLGDAKINQDKTPAGWLPLPRIPPRSHRYGCIW